MALSITGSPDLSLLSVLVTYDISGATPIITLTNQSQGPNLAAVSYAFTVQSPTTTYIHQGDISDPDETGIWSTAQITDNWPRPFSNIEWGIYTFYVVAKDSEGNVFTAPSQLANICRPNGNLPDSKNTYGKGAVQVQVRCDQARIYFQDVTNTSYKGITGTVGSSVLRVNFPMDDTGVVPTPFQINYFTTALVPVTYSGKGYQFLYTSIYDYDLGDDVHVRIKYLLSDTFGVFCNIDLMPLLCEYQKLIASIETGACKDVEEANRKLMLINPKFSLVVMGMFQPLTGIDVPVLIEEIITIGGFDCDCCNAATGITPAGSSAFDGYTFSVVPLGGDIEGEVVANGYNIQIQLSDVSYVFKICDQSPAQTTSFSVQTTTSGDGYTKTYCLWVEMEQLATDMLTVISTNGALVNLFNSIVLNSGDGNFNLIVDGGCIFQSSATCDYELTLSNIPADTTFAILINIEVGNVNIPLSFAFNGTNIPALQTYLNGLGIGTFVLTLDGSILLINTTANPNNIINLTYKISGTTYLANLSKECTGYVPVSANAVVQSIINYICDIDDSQVQTSAEYEICYVDENGTKQTETISEGVSLATAIAALAERGCTTVDYIVSLGSVNCTTIKEKFPEIPLSLMQANDGFLGTKVGQCATISPVESFLYMLTYGQYNAEVVAAFCSMVALCGSGTPCTPYSEFSATLIDYDTTCTNIIKLGASVTNPITINGLQWANTPTVNQTVFVEYALDDGAFDWTSGGSSVVDVTGTFVTPVVLTTTPGQYYLVRGYNACMSPIEYTTPQSFLAS